MGSNWLAKVIPKDIVSSLCRRLDRWVCGFQRDRKKEFHVEVSIPSVWSTTTKGNELKLGDHREAHCPTNRRNGTPSSEEDTAVPGMHKLPSIFEFGLSLSDHW